MAEWRHLGLSPLRGGEGVCAIGIWLVETTDAAKHPTLHRMAPMTEYPDGDVLSLETLPLIRIFLVFWLHLLLPK